MCLLVLCLYNVGEIISFNISATKYTVQDCLTIPAQLQQGTPDTLLHPAVAMHTWSIPA